jgi:hypothetical protein
MALLLSMYMCSQMRMSEVTTYVTYKQECAVLATTREDEKQKRCALQRQAKKHQKQPKQKEQQGETTSESTTTQCELLNVRIRDH